MSMELLVILALHKAPTVDAWQQALSARHVPVQFTEKVNLTKFSGFLPLAVDGHKSGFYFLTGKYLGLSSQYPALANKAMPNSVVYSLGYGGDFYECSSAFYAASALVSEFGGIAFEPQGGKVMVAQELTDAANQCYAIASKK